MMLYPKPKDKRTRIKKDLPITPKQCYATGATMRLHKHHIFGGPNRKHSEQYGLYVWLIPEYHNMSSRGVHFDKMIDLELKQFGQREFEKRYSREEFIKIFGRNYLD
jgi:hypothetical protein